MLAGAAAYNRLLVVVLLASLVAGLLALGPRATLRMPWPWLGALAALVVAAPQIAYQAGHDWPQLRMGRALSAENATEVRVLLLPMLLVMLGPPLVWIWVRGIRCLLDRERRHRFGFLAVGFAAFLIFALATGAQPHYPVHLLRVLYAAGCVPVGARLGAGLGGWHWAVLANGLVSVVLALPVVPATRLGATPLPQISQLVGDQVGWQRYVEQVATAYHRAGVARPRPGFRSLRAGGRTRQRRGRRQRGAGRRTHALHRPHPALGGPLAAPSPPGLTLLGLGGRAVGPAWQAEPRE